MSDTKYAYAVARIRALENGLFSSAQIEQLLSVKSYEGALPGSRRRPSKGRGPSPRFSSSPGSGSPPR